MKVRFWGTRGSFVAPGTAFQRYGGNTICTEVTSGTSRLVLDLGTGCIPLGHSLAGEAAKGGSKRFAVLLSHTQIDHIQGLPFFVPALVPGWDISIMGPPTAGRDMTGVLDSALNPNYSPLYGVENLAATLSLTSMQEGDIQVDGFRVKVRELPHGQTKALGFRIEADGASFAYLTDVEYGQDPPPAALELAMDADLLVHDAMDTAEEVTRRHGLGHASPEDAVRVAKEAGAKRLLLYHHDPDRTDPAMDLLLERVRRTAPGLDIDGAREGIVVELGRASGSVGAAVRS